MDSSLPNTIKRFLPGILLGLVVFIGLAVLGDVRQVARQIFGFNWHYFGIALLFTLFNYTLRFLKWHFYLRQLGVRSLPWAASLRIFVAGFPLAVTPGKVGEALKGVWLKNATGLPVARGIAVVVAERISDGLAVLALSVLGVVAYPQYWPAFALVLAGLLTVVILSQIRPAALWILHNLARIHFFRRAVSGLTEFYEGSFSLFRPGTMALAVLLGSVSWLGEGIGFFFILLGLGVPPSLHLAALAVFVLSFSTVVGAASALPGGLGAAEASIAGMLALMNSMMPATASAATLLIRLATLWFGVLLGLIVWSISPELVGFKVNDGKPVEG